MASTQDKPPSKTSSTNTFAFGAKTKAEATAQIEQLKKEGRLPTLDQWLAAVAKVRAEYHRQILAARGTGTGTGRGTRRIRGVAPLGRTRW
jgi:hypothetical protein